MDIPGATLPVIGATQDMICLARFVDRSLEQICRIHISLDSHQPVHIAHAAFWEDRAGKSPPAMTIITSADITAGIWTTRNRNLLAYAIMYTETLEASGKYQLIIWPDHGLVGSWGHNIQDNLASALRRWNISHQKDIDYILKGTNMLTEHYGMFQAEVPIPNDPATQLNEALLSELREADIVFVAGEASSHCFKASVEQIAEHIGAEHISKFHLLKDCTSPVGAIKNEMDEMVVDFPAIAEQFFADMAARGMTVTTSTRVHF